MKYTTTALSLLTLLSTTSAQSLGDIPSCATEPALKAITSSGCAISDAPCICKNRSFLDGLLPVVKAACSPEELQKTIDFTTKFCGDAGVNLAATSSSADASSPTTATSSAAVSAPSATSANGTMTPGNSTEGGMPNSPSPSPQAAPASGVAGLVGMAKNAGVLGVVFVGAVLML
ncbi:MAG: hypothetical protein Q9168_003753 [Polycauliona sp. 1 TL-2023]